MVCRSTYVLDRPDNDDEASPPLDDDDETVSAFVAVLILLSFETTSSSSSARHSTWYLMMFTSRKKLSLQGSLRELPSPKVSKAFICQGGMVKRSTEGCCPSCCSLSVR